MRVVVTGASGNVGTALLRRLGSGDHEIVGLCRRPPPPVPPYAGVEWASLDLGNPGDRPALRRLLEGADAVVNAAWQIQPSWRDSQLRRTNLVGVRMLLSAVAEARVPHLVHMSSIAAYAPGPKEPVDETYPVTGITSSYYSRHKAVVERDLAAFAEEHPETKVAMLRPGLIFQRDAAGGIARYFLPSIPDFAVEYTPVLPFADELVIQVVHADDVADALARILERGAAGPFNIASDPPITPPLLAELLGARYVPTPLPLIRQTVSVAWRGRVTALAPGWIDLLAELPLLSTARARDELAWTPSMDGPAATAELLAGLRANAGTASEALRPRDAVPAAGKRMFSQGPIGWRNLT